ncbi:MAG: DNA-binding protein, partial [Peptococcaceae bacterium]|nr:DNA-binding protein [Peptococcaceae bacterium]
MTLEQRARMAVLYDLYSGLLTDKQQEVFDLYYQ